MRRTKPQVATNNNFDLFRIEHSKAAVDISPNTIRKYAKEGLPLYKKGRATFASKAELLDFLTSK